MPSVFLEGRKKKKRVWNEWESFVFVCEKGKGRRRTSVEIRGLNAMRKKRKEKGKNKRQKVRLGSHYGFLSKFLQMDQNSALKKKTPAHRPHKFIS